MTKKKYYLIDVETGDIGEFKKKPKPIRWLVDGEDCQVVNGEVLIDGEDG